MSTLRKRFRVAWNDGDEIIATTSARDLVVAEDYDAELAGFALVHHALIRTGYDVPDLDTFVDTLDVFAMVDDEPSTNGDTPTSGADDADPTPAAGSANVP